MGRKKGSISKDRSIDAEGLREVLNAERGMARATSDERIGDPLTLVTFTLDGVPRPELWLSGIAAPPERVGTADDRTRADEALRRMRAGESLLYRGDFQNARQLLAALGRRLAPRTDRGLSPAESFRRERQRRKEAQALLHRLLVPVAPGWRVPLPRAPDVARALEEALGPSREQEGLLPLRELLGAIGAHEWRRKGVLVPALGARLHPHYGVFAPLRNEYADLVAEALAGLDLAGKTAFDVGTGTGLFAFLAARRSARVVATDVEPRAVACARENAERLGLSALVEVREADLFPEGRADLVLCNPPWVPAEPHGPLDRAVYDGGGRFLARFLAELPAHLAPGGEALLTISDLAERLGLRPPGALAEAIDRAGLVVAGKRTAAARHPRARDEDDPLHAARSGEVTALYVLRPSSAFR